MRKPLLTFISTFLILSLYSYSYAQNDKILKYESSPIKCKDVRKLLDTNDKNQLKDFLMKVVLSEEFELPFFVKNRCNVFAELFRINDHIRPALKSTLDNPDLFSRYAKLLIYFAEAEDRLLLIEKLDSLKSLRKAEIEAVRQYIAGGLVSPKSEREWELLKSMVTCEEPDMHWSLIEGAALALAANGSDRSLSILNASPICERPPAAESVVRLAIRWIKSHPKPVESFPDLKKSIIAASKIFNYSGKQDRFHIDKVTIDSLNQKALVFCTVNAGEDDYYYELVFQRVSDLWRLKGIWPAGVASYVIGLS